MSRLEPTFGDEIEAGRAILGIEFGSTRIKVCLIGEDPSIVLAVGSHEWANEYRDGMWTYSLDAIWSGAQSAYADLVVDVQRKYHVTPHLFRTIGISAMMHGYLAFSERDELLVPFRTWRNTTTAEASAELTALFGVSIPLRWSIAHLHQAVRDDEPHIAELGFITTLAGYVHWKLTGRRVVGVGDASGMFPIDPATGSYDANLLAKYAQFVERTALPEQLITLLPEVLIAGQPAGTLTSEGARLLDPTGSLQPGVPLCDPEGDAGTGMVATNAVAPRTGSVSVGTSVFAMVVLERPLRYLHEEVDIVATPAGRPVAMVHCNNGASELAEWVRVFHRFSEAGGMSMAPDEVYALLFREALSGASDGGGLFAYNQLAGEPIAGLDEGRPLFVRMPDSRLTLAGLVRAQLYGVFGILALGMRALSAEGVAVDYMFAHGGIFRTAGVAQRFLAAALKVPVSTSRTAAEGGAWGMAVLAAYAASGSEKDLLDYLRERVFAATELVTARPRADDVVGFATYLDRYQRGLDIVRAAVIAL